jgi:hypothetical protein
MACSGTALFTLLSQTKVDLEMAVCLVGCCTLLSVDINRRFVKVTAFAIRVISKKLLKCARKKQCAY